MIDIINIELDPKALKPYKNNARTHSDKQLAQIEASIKEFGFTNPVLVDEDNALIAGHGRALCAIKLGMATIPARRLTGLTVAQKKALILADNKIALNSGWDNSLLEIELKELQVMGFNVELTGFSGIEIGKIVTVGAVVGEDDVPDSVPPTSAMGDVWQCGRHLVMCGNAGDLSSCEKLVGDKKASLVFTDPPYGISYQSNMRTKSDKFSVIENDAVFLKDWVSNLHAVSAGWVFVWTTWRVLKKWIDICAPIGEMTNQIIWDKGGGGIGDLEGTFSTDYEIALVFNRGAKLKGKRIGSVWSFNKDASASYLHPTQKPVALALEAITKCTEYGDTVIDLFGGSGSTLIAAEKSGRIARIMEIDPAYVDIIVRRWEAFTGQKAINLATGLPFGEKAAA